MIKRLQLSGQRFGRLLVLEQIPERKRGATQWRCLCECGQQKIVIGSLLLNGNTVSCGCRRKESKNALALQGERFGRLLVIKEFQERTKTGAIQYICQCDCGRQTTIAGYSLARGDVSSCGCYRKEKLTTHGKRAIPEYSIWKSIKQRCNNISNRHYKNYGERGIKICNGWQENFANFIADMGERPFLNHSIDRIDNNKHYSCGHCQECLQNQWTLNCRWTTRKIQNRNRRSNRIVEYNGEKKTLTDWSEQLGINYGTLKDRLNNGWSIEKALTTPPKK